MSETYNTEELISYLLPAEGLGFQLLMPPEVYDAIIARLRAADKLCEAAKELGWMISVYPHIDLSKISKAIADYDVEYE